MEDDSSTSPPKRLRFDDVQLEDLGLKTQSTSTESQPFSQISELSQSPSIGTTFPKTTSDVLIESANYSDKTWGLLNEAQGKQSKWWGFYWEHSNPDQDPKASEWPKCKGCMKNISNGSRKINGSFEKPRKSLRKSQKTSNIRRSVERSEYAGLPIIIRIIQQIQQDFTFIIIW